MQFRRIRTVTVAVMAVVGVGGCNSGSAVGSGGSGSAPVDPAVVGAAALVAAARSAGDVIAGQAGRGVANLPQDARDTLDGVMFTAGLAAATDLPDTGTFRGSMVGGNADGGMMGDMELSVDFSGGTLSGVIYNLRGLAWDPETAEGAEPEPMILSALMIVGQVSGAGVVARVDGYIGDDVSRMDVQGSMAGEFRGVGASDGAGGIELRDADADADIDNIPFRGVWHVRRQ